MEQLTTAQIVEIFCEIDEFCKVYENYCQKNLLVDKSGSGPNLLIISSPPAIGGGENKNATVLKGFLLYT
jgi:hypothetical protein